MSHSCVSWVIHVSHESFICVIRSFLQFSSQFVTRVIHVCHGSFVCVMSHSYVSWVTYMCYKELTSQVSSCHKSFMRVMSHLYVLWITCVCHESFMCVPRVICVWHESFVCVIRILLHLSSQFVTRVIHASFVYDTSHSCVSWVIYMCYQELTSHNSQFSSWHESISSWDTSFMRVLSHSCVSWVICVWHKSFMRLMGHLYVLQGAYFERFRPLLGEM